MFRKLVIIVTLVLMVSWLSGCTDQISDVLTKINQLIGQELSEDESANAEDKEEEEPEQEQEPLNSAAEDEDKDEETDQNAEETDDDSVRSLYDPELVFDDTYIPENIQHMLPIDDRLKEQGYKISREPSGFPLKIPYQWIYVTGDKGDSDIDNIVGEFCFDIPQPISVVATYFDEYYDDVEHEFLSEDNNVIHQTRVNVDEEFEVWEADISYHLDEHDNTCALVEVAYDWDAVGQVGEDPDTMISDDELADELQGESTGAFHEQRDRVLPEGFEGDLAEVRDEHDYYDDTFALSIKDAIMNKKYDMGYMEGDLPHIYLFDSYVITEKDSQDPNEWPVTMCTDIPLHAMVAKHLDLLGNYNADIVYFAKDGTNAPTVVAEVEFQFNSEYDDGSYEGMTSFIITPEGEGLFPQKRCMTTELYFQNRTLD